MKNRTLRTYKIKNRPVKFVKPLKKDITEHGKQELFLILMIIKELVITNNAPIKVKTLGTSLQIKKPKTIAKTKLKYLIGVTNDASASL